MFEIKVRNVGCRLWEAAPHDFSSQPKELLVGCTLRSVRDVCISQSCSDVAMPKYLFHDSNIAAFGYHYCSGSMPAEYMQTPLLRQSSFFFIAIKYVI